jgi:rubrerythrin
MIMAKLFRCRVCGDPYVGETRPSRCPWCGAYENFMVEAKDYKETFDVILNETDMKNVEHALEVEISNAEFYFCAAEKSDDDESRQLFKALGKVEAEHASIWTKILKKPKQAIGKSASCSITSKDNLLESHNREDRAINFYKKAAAESTDKRVKMLFAAIVQVETDHLQLSEERLK